MTRRRLVRQESNQFNKKRSFSSLMQMEISFVSVVKNRALGWKWHPRCYNRYDAISSAVMAEGWFEKRWKPRLLKLIRQARALHFSRYLAVCQPCSAGYLSSLDWRLASLLECCPFSSGTSLEIGSRRHARSWSLKYRSAAMMVRRSTNPKYFIAIRGRANPIREHALRGMKPAMAVEPQSRIG